MEIYNSIVIHIFSVKVHYRTGGIHTLYHFPCQMLWHKYDVHLASLYFYLFHIYDFIFPRPYFLSIDTFIFQLLKY